jgi:hypothetical protein
MIISKGENFGAGGNLTWEKEEEMKGYHLKGFNNWL